MVRNESAVSAKNPVRPIIHTFPNDVVDAEVPAQDDEGSARMPLSEDDTHEEFSEKIRAAPAEASHAEREHHEATGHAVYRSWCSECKQGRGRTLAHHSRSHSDDRVPVLSWDYGFLSTHGNEPDVVGNLDTPLTESQEAECESSGQSPVLCLRDRMSQACYWYLLPCKGRNFPAYQNLLHQICDDLNGLGYPRVCFRSDGEPALQCVLGDVKARWQGEVVPEATPEGDSSSNGNAECGVGLMKGHTRTLKFALERKLGIPLPENHNIFTWRVKFAASTYRR